ncbi:hypothetical protein [Alicyclobacillus mengziensis]|uniref:Uncharacterized protein n=1 Tax=Alicyclobacillus mengziensis TaxID=2931921 RepID=A0A9X7Z6S2_9BACL|nr:hypothetical protein [Alicyclobacillus mengziensis]QSO46518.1 hypothetical protein JZ786_18930 [Alicyclobacillus mengziensis]
MADLTPILIYDNRFNANEWFVLSGLCVGIFFTYVLPRRFTTRLSILYFMLGVSFGTAFDLTLGTIPVSYYDIGDASNYQLFDIISLFMYGPFSYLFFYLYDLLKVQVKFSPIYILVWSFVALVLELVGVLVGEFHYQHGYGWQISLLIYLTVLSLWVLFHYLMKSAESPSRSRASGSNR